MTARDFGQAFGFGKASRLLNAGDYQRVFDRARLKVSTPELLILAHPNQLGHPRLGLVIAKKHVKLAVKRNRVKRILRESFRLHQHSLPPLDIIVLGRKGLDTLDAPQLHQSCRDLWRRLQRKANKHQGGQPCEES